MKIVHVITGMRKAAGTTTFVENVVCEQRTLGHTVDICTNQEVNKYLCQPQPPTSTYSIIHIHGLWSPLLHKAARFARKNKIPVVWSTHGMTAPWSLHHKWWKKCLPWYLYQKPDLKSAALIHCTTDLEADWNHALGFKNVFVAPLGTTLPEGRACGPSRAAIDAPTNDALNRDFDRRQQKKLPRLVPLTEAVRTVVHHQNTAGSYPQDENNVANPSSPRKGADNNSTVQPSTSNLQPRTLLYVGRIYPVKALDNAIRALALVNHANHEPRTTNHAPPITLRIVGPDQAGHMAELMSLCDSLHLPYTKPGDNTSTVQPSTSNLQPLVQFIGPKYDADLSAEYDACDALVLVSHTENFGATVIDALAHSKPVITSTNTPWGIVVKEGCGWCVGNEPKILSNAMMELMTIQPSRLREMGEAGRHLVEREYSWDSVARRLEGEYRKVIKREEK